MQFMSARFNFHRGVTPKVQPDLTAFSVLAPMVEEEPVAAEG
jgi:hypothetical protein